MGRLWQFTAFLSCPRSCEKKDFFIRRCLLKADEEIEINIAFSGEGE